MRQSYFLLLLLCCFAATSQNKINLKGQVLDGSSQVPLEAATVYISSVSDSTMIDYTITDHAGNFSLTTQKIDKPVIVKISYTGFQIMQIEEKALTADKDYGILRLSDAPIELGEVVVKTEAPPVRIKNDTLEFNASSFKLRPDANVEALLKQLPGVEIDADGKITVNGKEVNQILVNGKPFFDKDGKIAMQNLPSEIINKVQVTDSKTKKEELSGAAATSNNASINLTIDEAKNKGFFGKITGGYGTDDRYESSLLLNYFKGERKISVLGSINNINTSGFSMNEIFDSMGGGRNMSIYTSDNGSFGINGMRFGGGSGITRSTILGMNYADQWFKDFDITSNYFFTGANTSNVNYTRQLNLLPEGNFTTESNSTSENDNYAHNFNADFEFKLDSTTTVYFSPKFVSANSKSNYVSDEASTTEAGQVLNESTADNRDKTDSQNFSGNLYITKKLNKRNRELNFSFENENTKEDVFNLNRSEATFYEDADSDGVNDQITQDARNQQRFTTNLKDSYSLGLDYKEPLKDSLYVKAGVQVSKTRNSEDRETFDFDPAGNSYSAYNDVLSRFLESDTKQVNPWAGFSIEKKALYFQLTLGTTVTDFDNQSNYLGQLVSLKKDYMLPSANSYVNYKLSKTLSIYANYQYVVNFPTARQLLPVLDVSDVLNTYVGNPELEPDKYHQFYFGFRDYDFATKSGYNFYAGGSYFDSQVVSSTTFDASRKRNTTYENVSNSFFSWLGGSWNKSIKKEANSYKFGISVNAVFNRNRGFTNGEMYEANSARLTPRFTFNYDYGELFSINPSYNFTLNSTNYTNYLVDHASTVMHRFNVQITSYWPKHVVFGNDFGYTYNSNIADGFKKDFYLWNTSLGYNFLNDKLLAKVKVYDVLDQNQSNTRTITETTIRDEENTVLKRYLMFSLTYKLGKFDAKKDKRH